MKLNFAMVFGFLLAGTALSAPKNWDCTTAYGDKTKMGISITGHKNDASLAFVKVFKINGKEKETVFINERAKVYSIEDEIIYHVPVSQNSEHYTGGKLVAGTKLQFVKYFRLALDKDSRGGDAGIWEDGSPFAIPEYHLGTLNIRKLPLKADQTEGKKTGSNITVEMACEERK